MHLLMLLPLIGFVLFFRRTVRLDDSVTILHTVSGMLLALYLGAVLGWLQLVSFGLTAIGFFLLIWAVLHYFKEREFQTSVPIVLFIALPSVFWMVHTESLPLFWDEYSHWGIYIRELAATHKLWTVETNASHPDYPPGTALFHYFFVLLPGYDEGAVYLAQFVFLITPLLVLFESINLKQLLWVPALLALLALGLANFGNGIVSLYTDHILSVWYAGILLQGVRSSPERPVETALLALPLTLLLLIKDAGLPLFASAIAFLLCLQFYRHISLNGWTRLDRRMILGILVLVCLPLLFRFSWQLNRETVGVTPGKEGTGLVEALLTEKFTFSKQDLETYRNNFWEVVSDQQLSRNKISLGFNEFGYRLKKLFKEEFRLTLMGLLVLFPLWSVIVVVFSRHSEKVALGLGLSIVYLTAIAYILLMYLTYPLIHPVERAQNLVSFLRYAHTVSLPMLLLGMGLLAPAFQRAEIQLEERVKISRSSVLFGLALMLFYVFETPYLRPFYVSATYENHPSNTALRWRKNTDALTNKVREIIGRKRVWIYLPIQDNGFLSTAIRYQMTPTQTVVERSPKFMELSITEISDIWKNHDYLWFAVANPRTSFLFEEKMGRPLASHRLTRVEAIDNTLNLHPIDLR